MLFSVPDFIGFACREVGKINKVIVHTVSVFDIIPFNKLPILPCTRITHNLIFIIFFMVVGLISRCGLRGMFIGLSTLVHGQELGSRYFGCHYPRVGVSSEGIVVVQSDITLFHLAHPNTKEHCPILLNIDWLSLIKHSE